MISLHFQEGSLRIIRNGIGIQEHASIDLADVKGLWALATNSSNGSHLHNMLIVSLVGQTRALSLTGEEVEDTELPGFDHSEQTFFAANIGLSTIVQITAASVRLIDGNTKSGVGLFDEYKLPGDTAGKSRRIGVASCNPAGRQVVVASGRDLFYLTVHDQGGKPTLKEEGRTTLEFEAACLDISPIGGTWFC